MNALPSATCLNTKQTPYYYYDTQLLHRTLDAIKRETDKHAHFEVHYALKANAHPQLLHQISQAGFGADCVSGGEITAALKAGFPTNKIVFAGVGKRDEEIRLALQQHIFCFHVESLEELEVINVLATQEQQVARVALRINPNVGAHTHAHITTGLSENKFGIPLTQMNTAIEACSRLKHITLIGLHFHIGSQITDMSDFVSECQRINELQTELNQHDIHLRYINVGGGLGVNYDDPDGCAIPDFQAYFDTFAQHLHYTKEQTIHFELGRSVVAQCGSLISKVLYIKEGEHKKFCIIDAGMTELLRPALYQAHHKIENRSSQGALETYDVVGPICESSDVMAQGVLLPSCHRGDILAIRSAGAYGESMASQYNGRPLVQGYLSKDFSSEERKI